MWVSTERSYRLIQTPFKSAKNIIRSSKLYLSYVNEWSHSLTRRGVRRLASFILSGERLESPEDSTKLHFLLFWVERFRRSSSAWSKIYEWMLDRFRCMSIKAWTWKVCLIWRKVYVLVMRTNDVNFIKVKRWPREMVHFILYQQPPLCLQECVLDSANWYPWIVTNAHFGSVFVHVYTSINIFKLFPWLPVGC